MFNSMHVATRIEPDTFKIPAVGPKGERLPDGAAEVRVMRSLPGLTVTSEEHVRVPWSMAACSACPSRTSSRLFVFERHHDTGTYAAGFSRGFGITARLRRPLAHDAHNLLVVGDNDEDMALAAQALIDCGGGEVAVRDGRILGWSSYPFSVS